MFFINGTDKYDIPDDKEMLKYLQHPYCIIRSATVKLINDENQRFPILTSLIHIPGKLFQCPLQSYH